jgi:hypothetical protein
LEPYAPRRMHRAARPFAAAVVCAALAFACVSSALAAPEPDPAPQTPSVSPDPVPGAAVDPPAPPPQPLADSQPQAPAPTQPAAAPEPAAGKGAPQPRQRSQRRRPVEQRREASPRTAGAMVASLPQIKAVLLPEASTTDDSSSHRLVPLAAGALLALVLASGAMLWVSTRALRGQLG